MSDAAGAPLQRTVGWTSANPTIASVSASGDVAALAPGLARIVAITGTLADTATIVVRAQNLIVQPSAINLSVGETVQLAVSTPNGAVTSYGATVVWTSSNERVARIAPDGTLSGVGAGEVTLTASVNGTQGSAVALVRQKDLASLRVGPATSSIYTGETEQMVVTGYDDNGRLLPLEPSDVKWSVSDTKIASISSTGSVTGGGKGSTVVSARLGNKQSTASLNVLSLPAANVAVSLASSTLEVGQTTQATAVVTDANSATIAAPVLAWQSSNPALATVNASGLVTAVARGTVTISAISDGKVGNATLTIATKSVASVAVTPNPAAALKGQTAQLTATAKDAQGNALAGRTFTWTSTNTDVATVSSTGLVTSIGSGSTTITATSENVAGTATFSTTQQVVANVVVTPTTASILPGQDLQLTATATDGGGTVLTGRIASWSSSNPTVATVSSTGKVTAIARGTASITATIDGKSGGTALAVNEPAPAPVASITVTLNSPSITVGQNTQAVAVLKDANGNTLTGRTISWTSEAPTLATVSSTGSVTAIAAGTATITASAEGKSGNTTLVIQPPPQAPVASVTLSAASSSMIVGQSQPVTVTLRDAQGNLLSGRSISWSSSNLSAVSVAPSGAVTALGAGSAIVTATSEGKSGSMTFTVASSTPIAPVSSVTVTAPSTTLAVGQSTTATATLKDGHGVVLTGRTVTWSSSAPNVASVSSTGVVTAVAAGTAVISASSEGIVGSLPFVVTTPGGSATVTVTVGSSALTVGQTTQATAVAKDGSGATLSGTPSWSSSNSTVATVSASGLITAVGAGTAEVRATMAGAQGSAALSVTTSGGNTVTATPPELPRSVPSFTVPAATRSYTVSTDLQRALDTAKAGDEIRLSGTFTGNFVLPAKACGSWITIRSVAEPPAPGVRVTPATAAGYARVVSPNNAPAIKTVNPTCGWRLLGFAITGTYPQTGVQYGIVWLGDGGWTGGGETQTDSTKVPRDFVVDRMYIYGSSTLNSTRCIALNTGATVIRDSWISECHAAGFDSQAIGGWNGPGPYLIENNTLEGAGENVMFGGADPGINGMVPSDITIRRNHFNKPLSWKGGPWSIKNLFELKTARRLLVEGNVFENVWPASQEGVAIVIKSNANGCQCTFLGSTDLTFRYNIVRNAAVGLGLHASDDSYGWTGFIHTQRLRFEHNLFTNIGNDGTRQSLMLFTQDLKDVELANNTMVQAPSSAGLTIPMAYSFGAARRIVLRDNVLTATTGYAFHNSDNGSVHTNALNAFANDGSFSFMRNVLGGMLSDYVPLNPSASWYPSSVAAIGLAADYSLGSGSPYKGRGLGGTDPGADIAELTRRTAGAVAP